MFRVIGSQIALVIIKAKPDRLVQHLIEETDSSVDDNFVQDFLLMYRVFIFDPTEIMHKLMSWFDDSRYREKVARIVLIWINNHFNDFETNKIMLKLLEQFELASFSSGSKNIRWLWLWLWLLNVWSHFRILRGQQCTTNNLFWTSLVALSPDLVQLPLPDQTEIRNSLSVWWEGICMIFDIFPLVRLSNGHCGGKEEFDLHRETSKIAFPRTPQLFWFQRVFVFGDNMVDSWAKRTSQLSKNNLPRRISFLKG